MENFLLTRKNSLDKESIQISFRKYFPESDGIFRDIGDSFLCLFRKGTEFPLNFYENNDSFIGAYGTPVYKGLSYTQGLKQLLKDESENVLNTDDLLGHFYVFIWNGYDIKVLNDGSGLLKAYYDLKNQCLCSSFLVLTEILKGSLSLNKAGISENLLTGGITGGETIINEIKEFRTKNTRKFPGINIITPENLSVEKFKNRNEALERQISILDSYFSSLKNMVINFGVDSGLTGGLDSRLILGLVRKHLSNYQVHSHFRAAYHPDFEIAKEITGGLKIKLVSPEVTLWDKKTEEQKQDTFNNVLRFTDGQIRQHSYWTEDYNTEFYLNRVLSGKGLGLQGIGGEQYRNVDRSFLKGLNFDRWIYFNHIGKFTGFRILQDPVCKEIAVHIKEKVTKELDFETGKKNISLLDLKKIVNEVLIPSFRGIRTNSENRTAFSLSPFADFRVSQAAYSIVPFLGSTFNFEIDLIKYFAPDLAGYRSTYGYSLKRREPFRSYLLPVLIRNFIPPNLALQIQAVYKSGVHKKKFMDDFKNEGFLNSCLENFRGHNISPDIPQLLSNPETSNMLFSMGFLIGKLNHRLI